MRLHLPLSERRLLQSFTINMMNSESSQSTYFSDVLESQASFHSITCAGDGSISPVHYVESVVFSTTSGVTRELVVQ